MVARNAWAARRLQPARRRACRRCASSASSSPRSGWSRGSTARRTSWSAPASALRSAAPCARSPSRQTPRPAAAPSRDERTDARRWHRGVHLALVERRHAVVVELKPAATGAAVAVGARSAESGATHNVPILDVGVVVPGGGEPCPRARTLSAIAPMTRRALPTRVHHDAHELVVLRERACRGSAEAPHTARALTMAFSAACRCSPASIPSLHNAQCVRGALAFTRASAASGSSAHCVGEEV